MAMQGEDKNKIKNRYLDIFETQVGKTKSQKDNRFKEAKRYTAISAKALQDARVALKDVFDRIPSELNLVITDMEETSGVIDWTIHSQRYGQYRFRLIAERKKAFHCTIAFEIEGRSYEQRNDERFEPYALEKAIEYMVVEMGKIVGEETGGSIPF